MNIHSLKNRKGASRGGFTVLVILVLLTIMVLLTAANTATLNWLHRRIQIVDRMQVQRWGAITTNAVRAASGTNQPPAQIK